MSESNSSFTIRHGDFQDVDGPARRSEDITFVPARIALKGKWFEPACPLKDCLADVSAETKAIVHPGEDAPWVLGRLIRLFCVEQIPAEDRVEKSCFFASFLAVLPQDGNLAIPFECSDYYGRSELTFSTDDPPDASLQDRIARAFWRLLLADPTDIAEYEDEMFHSGAGITMRFGVRDGEPFMEEST